MALVQENRWEARPKMAFALKAVVYLGPLVAASASALMASRMIQSNFTDLAWPLVSLLTLPIAFGVLVVGQRLLRRLLPLALLLQLSLLFPDQVPNRLGTALRAASPKRLLARLEAEDPVDVSVAERVITLAAALNAHDRRTRGHSERVRALTMLVADEMGIVGEERDKLEWAALLHDLGKLEVPSEILNKKGRPSDAEWQILREHPAAGPAHASTLADWLGDWIHAMDQHHERFDGSGYPRGLRAHEISTSGRIVAVTDAFEVMTATRSYKTPMSTQAARTELVACSGSHFDPETVRSFMAISLGDVHRALGPTSWLASLPFSTVTAPIATFGSGIVGGSVSPALAAAAALTLIGSASIEVPVGTSSSSMTGDAPAAIAEVVVTDEAEAPAGDVDSDDMVLSASARGVTVFSSRTDNGGWPGAFRAESAPTATEVEAPGSDADDVPVDEAPADAVLDDLPADDVFDELPVDDVAPTPPIVTETVAGVVDDVVTPVVDTVDRVEEQVTRVTKATQSTVQPLVEDVGDTVDEVVSPVVRNVLPAGGSRPAPDTTDDEDVDDATPAETVTGVAESTVGRLGSLFG